jgi:rubredoxin|tara:strand:- start:561 stop:998 length:438 start_codon:yes stop_codon:yes gene_type:complete
MAKKKKTKKKRPRQANLDRAFSQLIRERDDYNCQVCGNNFRHDPGLLDCSHHVGRARGNTRWYPDNASSKCRSCHGKMDLNPLEHTEWIRKRLGMEKYEQLKHMAGQLLKMTDQDRRELLNALRKDHQMLLTRRAMGEIGELDLE